MAVLVSKAALQLEKAGVAELADALDSKSSDRKIVWVRAPPPAENLKLSSTRKNQSGIATDRIRSGAKEKDHANRVYGNFMLVWKSENHNLCS